ncbi:Protein BOBBER 1 [Symbiodinium microadriaticum]|uniref:Protein BOBBER 1 n=1 Tax=Symbiodinium microadriaticum TaxID=2951 RepID=A0A1Q9DUV3_SYMMI|nr:Protein BOBBER 1 [Symbiodinium microadriaticum]
MLCVTLRENADQEQQERNRVADEERKRKADEKKKKDEEEYRKRMEEAEKSKANAPKIEEVTEEEASQIKADKAKKSNDEEGGEDKEAEEKEDKEPPPPGNGGKTEKYTWTQTLGALEVFVHVPPGSKAKQIICDIGGDTLKLGTQAFVRSLSGELKMPGMKRPSAADMGEKGDQGQGGRNRKSKKGGESQTEAEDNTLVKSLAGCPKPREIPSFATKVQKNVADAFKRRCPGVKGQPLILDGKMHSKVKPDDCMWTLVDNKIVQITLEKFDNMKWWSCVMEGDAGIDTKKTSVTQPIHILRRLLEEKQHDLLEKFKAAHPELDFSKAVDPLAHSKSNLLMLTQLH